MRATASTSPLPRAPAARSTRRNVAGNMRTAADATASRSVSGLTATSTMRAWPRASACDSRCARIEAAHVSTAPGTLRGSRPPAMEPSEQSSLSSDATSLLTSLRPNGRPTSIGALRDEDSVPGQPERAAREPARGPARPGPLPAVHGLVRALRSLGDALLGGRPPDDGARRLHQLVVAGRAHRSRSLLVEAGAVVLADEPVDARVRPGARRRRGRWRCRRAPSGRCACPSRCSACSACTPCTCACPASSAGAPASSPRSSSATSPLYSLVARQAMTDMAFVGPMTMALALGALALFDDDDVPLPRRELRIGSRKLEWPHHPLFYVAAGLFTVTALPQLIFNSIALRWSFKGRLLHPRRRRDAALHRGVHRVLRPHRPHPLQGAALPQPGGDAVRACDAGQGARRAWGCRCWCSSRTWPSPGTGSGSIARSCRSRSCWRC